MQHKPTVYKSPTWQKTTGSLWAVHILVTRYAFDDGFVWFLFFDSLHDIGRYFVDFYCSWLEDLSGNDLTDKNALAVSLLCLPLSSKHFTPVLVSVFIPNNSLSWSRMLRYVVALCLLAVSWAQDCQVANIQVMQNFDKTRVSWKILRDLLSSVIISISRMCNTNLYPCFHPGRWRAEVCGGLTWAFSFS